MAEVISKYILILKLLKSINLYIIHSNRDLIFTKYLNLYKKN